MFEWQNKLESKGFSCLELTSDSPFYETKDLSKHTILIATPEKIDSLQRSLESMRKFISRINLLMVDEIHTISEQPRGACLEAVLTRLIVYSPRVIAVTATCSNMSDFSITRKTAENTAEFLARELISSNGVPQELIGRISSDLLRDCLSKGVGFHHAGVNPVDRRLIEEAFIEGHIPVLVSTSTLSMGINLPAHLVIIKNTSLYVEGTTQEYTSRQIIQMIGRAGRPQFDTSATAVIMTTADKQEHYEHWLEDSENVESSLHACLTDFLNVEIALDQIRSFDEMSQWISRSYLAVRLPKNPTFYGFQRYRIESEPEGWSFYNVATDFWKEFCRDALNKLISVGAVTISDIDRSIGSTIIGQIMCEHFLSAVTVELFFRLTGTEVLEDLIYYIAGCVEMNEISIRSQEKGALNSINRSTGVKKLRYPVRGRITTPQLKIVTLLQAELNEFVILDSGLQQESHKTFRAFNRCAAGLRNLLWTTKSNGREVSNIGTQSLPQSAAMSGFACMAHVIELAKVVANRVWADAPLASLRQLPDIGKDYASQLAGAGVTSLKDIERVGPRFIERILRRQPPFGDRVYESALEVPKYELAAEQLTTNATDQVEFEFAIRLTRSCKFDQVALMVADDKNRIIFKTVLSTKMLESSGGWSQIVVVHYDPAVHYLFTSLISFNFLGIDLNINFPIPWPESTNNPFSQGLPAKPTTDRSIDIPLPVTVSPYISSAPTLEKTRRQRKETARVFDFKSRTIKGTKPPKTSQKSEAVMSTPKVTNDGFKQTNIMNFFKATKSLSEKTSKSEPAISPITKPGILPSASIFKISNTSSSEVSSSLLTPFTPDPPSIQSSPLIKSTSEIQPPHKKIKWGNDDGEKEISPETDKMVEEELCSFLSTVEATEAKERSVNAPSFQMKNNFSPILPVDLDATDDNLKSLEPKGYSTPVISSTHEGNQRDELNFIPSFHVDRTISPIFPLDTKQSLLGDSCANAKILNQTPFIHTPSKQSLIKFKTPKDMQLFTSLDDLDEFSPPPNEKTNRSVFKVPFSATPKRHPLKQILAPSSRTPRTTNSAKVFKKVSFSIVLPKSESGCGDTGYGSSPISKETRSTDVPVMKEVTKGPLTVSESLMERRPRTTELKETKVRKEFLKAPPSTEVDSELLREGWDQLATFIYCYNILRKFDSENTDCVYLSAPRTPHDLNDRECPRDTCAPSTADINSAIECPSPRVQSPYPPHLKSNTIDSKETPQVEE
nr:ATP dependent DNA helicase HFM1 [Hymenolepis microstoma]